MRTRVVDASILAKDQGFNGLLMKGDVMAVMVGIG